MTCSGEGPNVFIGQTWVYHYANIRNVAMYDTNSGKIGIKPIGKSEVLYTVKDGDLINVESDEYYISVRVRNMWYSATTKFMTFEICWEPKFVGPVECNQEFRLQDQNGNPLNGSVSIGTAHMSVLGFGIWELEQGISFTAIAKFGDYPIQTKTFTACINPIIFTFVVPTIGTLNCYSVPTGATIYINGIDHGVTNKEGIELNPGDYTVLLRKDGYNDVTQTVTIELGLPGTVSINLTSSQVVVGKEYVFEFSGPITLSAKITDLINKLVILIGGKSFYIEYNKIVVVM